ncbi:MULTISPECIES: hypothetical protein [Alteribacter]|nr:MULTISPECIES: hypothetical protein [Alteribacter]
MEDKNKKKQKKTEKGRADDRKLHYQVYIQDKRSPHPKEEEDMNY